MVTLPPILRDAPELPLLLEKGAFFMGNERLARNDFRDWLTPDLKAEFINGEKFVHSPSRYAHSDVQMRLSSMLCLYAEVHDLGVVLGEKTLVAFSRNDYEPDVVFFGKEKAAGFKASQMIFPVPDLIVEILSDSTADRDRGVKFRDYAVHEVPEYWIIDADAQRVERYVNLSGKFVLQTQPDEFLETALFPGLRLPLKAIFDSEAKLQFLRTIFAR